MGWVASWPARASTCGFDSPVLSAAPSSRRLKPLGLLPDFLFFVSWVVELATLGVIRGADLIIDSTFLRAWCTRDATRAAGWYDQARQGAERFGFKVHTIIGDPDLGIGRWSSLPLLFLGTPANGQARRAAIPLFWAVQVLYGFTMRIVRGPERSRRMRRIGIMPSWAFFGTPCTPLS